MAYLKKYIDATVYEEAKKRIKHIYDTFDTVCVSFSGGKDSLVVLHLNDEVRNELGIKEKPTVIFRDEELIPDEVLEFVKQYRDSGKYDFRYFAVQMESSKFILGKTYRYIQWDNTRNWIREKPPFAITEDDPEKVFDQYGMDEYVTRGLNGKIAILTGIRADESIFRFRASVNKKHENYINATSFAHIKVCKPIFDWSQKDVFKYFYDNRIAYCHLYDLEMWNGDSLRVSTPLHAESAKKFHKLKTLSPTFYNQVVSVFPEMLIQDRYWKEYDQYSILHGYEKSWKGILQYIKDHIKDTDEKKKALTMLTKCKAYKEMKYELESVPDNFGGYPLLYVFKSIIAGNYKRKIMPVSRVSKADIEYERATVDQPERRNLRKEDYV